MNEFRVGNSWELVKGLKDGSVDCVVTSPPYWGLRDYGVQGQAGLEEHPQLWVDKMVELCELIKPKLKKGGVMFWNIGETYHGSGGSGGDYLKGGLKEGQPTYKQAFRSGEPDPKLPERLRAREQFKGEKSNWLQPKQMLGLPWRFAIAMQEKGWILRNAVVWVKPNHMPSSVKDRFSNGFEYVFMFVKSRKYWFDLDSVREPHHTGIPAKFNIRVREVQKGTPEARLGSVASEFEINNYDEKQMRDSVKRGFKSRDRDSILVANRPADYVGNVGGKNCGDVWRITTRPHPFSHFAVFPEELAERCIKSGCPEWVCKKCGKPRERITKINYENNPEVWGQQTRPKQDSAMGETMEGFRPLQNLLAVHNTVGWSVCGCNAGWQGGVVLDPFMGSGTVAVVAKRLNRQWLGFELNPKYVQIAERRLAGVKDWDTIKDVDAGVQQTIHGGLRDDF